MVDPDWPYSSARAADVRVVTVDCLLDLIAAVEECAKRATGADGLVLVRAGQQLRQIMEGNKHG